MIKNKTETSQVGARSGLKKRNLSKMLKGCFYQNAQILQCRTAPSGGIEMFFQKSHNAKRNKGGCQEKEKLAIEKVGYFLPKMRRIKTRCTHLQI